MNVESLSLSSFARGPKIRLVRVWEKFLSALTQLLCLAIPGYCLTISAYPVDSSVVIPNFELGHAKVGGKRKRQQCGGIMHGNCDATTTGEGRQTFPKHNRALILSCFKDFHDAAIANLGPLLKEVHQNLEARIRQTRDGNGMAMSTMMVNKGMQLQRRCILNSLPGLIFNDVTYLILIQAISRYIQIRIARNLATNLRQPPKIYALKCNYDTD